MTETWWALRPDRTGGLTETIIEPAHRGEHARKQTHCPRGDGLLKAREHVPRTVETLGGSGQCERPYCYGTACRGGVSPFDAALGVAPGRKQLDVQKAAAKVVTAMP